MTKPLILIIDEEENIRDMIRMKLESCGFEVRGAEDGITGIDLTKELKPDIILLDLAMPGMNGVEILSRLKEDDRTKNLKVFIFTGQGTYRADINEVSKRFAIKEGAVGFIRKETDLDELAEKLKEAVAKKAI